jgi:acetyltransferase-like isoleucine patch superfamily enzyme
MNNPHHYTPGKPWIDGEPSRVHIHDPNKLGTWMLLNTYCGTITIEKDAFFGQRCMLLAGGHDITMKNSQRFALSRDRKDILIKEGVFVGSGAIIIGPCTIGEHAVIGAGSVVLPGVYRGGCVYAGNPAKFKKEIEFQRLHK